MARQAGATEAGLGAEAEARLQDSVLPGSVVVAGTGRGRFEQRLLDGRHALTADEPEAVGGSDAGPGPYELLLMALGACTAMTMQMYAARKGWPLERAVVRLDHARVHGQDCVDCGPKDRIDRITREIDLVGELDDEQRQRLLQIAEMCPVHRTLTSTTEIRSYLAE